MTESQLRPHRAAGGDRRSSLAFLYLPLVDPRDLRLQPEPHPGLAAVRLHAALVRRGVAATRRVHQAPSATRSSPRPCATAIALVLGTLAALAVQRYDFFGRETISFVLVLPIALPGVVTGIALRTTFKTFGVDLRAA